MGVFDKFLDIMKLSDEHDYEDAFFDDEVDEYPEKTSKNPFKKEKEEYYFVVFSKKILVSILKLQGKWNKILN